MAYGLVQFNTDITPPQRRIFHSSMLKAARTSKADITPLLSPFAIFKILDICVNRGDIECARTMNGWESSCFLEVVNS